MKPAKTYALLVELAHKFSIEVVEQNFKVTGLPVNSGICKVGQQIKIVLDKHKTIEEKIDIVVDCLREYDTESVYIVPALRDLFPAAGALDA
jgi:hypothetical protein